MNTAKDEVQSLLKNLPDDCTLEDVQYHLYVIEKIRMGIKRAETEGAISQEEAERRLRKYAASLKSRRNWKNHNPLRNCFR